MQGELFLQLLLILASALVCVALAKRFNLPTAIGYLLAGIILGDGFHLLGNNTHTMVLIGHLGLVFLLFALGLEFSIAKMVAMRRLVFGVGTLQVIAGVGVFFALGQLIDQPRSVIVIIALALTFSSTALVTRELQERGLQQQVVGQTAVSILIMQDLLAIPVIVLIPELAADINTSAWPLVGVVVRAFAAFALIVAIGKWLLPPLMHHIVSARSDEILVLGILVLALGAAGITQSFGLSMSLGAFMGGVMLGESRYRLQIESELRPFKDLMLGVFFMAIGLQLDIAALIQNWYWVLITIAALLMVKPPLIYLACRLFGLGRTESTQSGLILFQGGEFGFVIITLALLNNLIPADIASIVVSAGIVSMLITPLVMQHSAAISRWLFSRQTHPDDETASLRGVNAAAVGLEGHVIICGYGRVGQTISRFLGPFELETLALDNDPLRVQEAIAGGERVVFGDSQKKDILRAAGVHRARLLAISFDDFEAAIRIIVQARALNPKLTILCRTRDDSHLSELLAAGATEVIPEIMEGAMMLVAHVLMLAGIPLGRVLRILQDTRANRYSLLHGYYHGQQSDPDITDTRVLQKLHAVTLGEKCWASGRLIKELDTNTHAVELVRLNRPGAMSARPDSNMVLRAGDALLVLGEPERIEAFERYLLTG